MILSGVFLFQLISQNQQRFIDLLNAPSDPAEQGGGGGGVGVGDGSGGGGAGGFQIQVTQEEKAAIDRVSFTMHYVIFTLYVENVRDF